MTANSGSVARRRAVTVTTVLVTAATVVLALGLLRSVPAGADVPPTEDAFAVPGGYLVVRGVAPEVMAMPAGMPRSMMPDPVPAGQRRVTVEVSLLARDDAPLTYEADDLTLRAPGVPPASPRRDSIGSGTVPPGARVAGSLLFQVPQGTDTYRLRFRGARGSVVVTVPRGGGHHHGDGGGAGEGGGAPAGKVPRPRGGVAHPDHRDG